jgi:hypothetical protein
MIDRICISTVGMEQTSEESRFGQQSPGQEATCRKTEREVERNLPALFLEILRLYYIGRTGRIDHGNVCGVKNAGVANEAVALTLW